jgi:hypothetical protein
MKQSVRENNLGCLPADLQRTVQLLVNEWCKDGAKYAPLDAIMDAAYEIWMEDQQLTDGDMTLWEIADTYMPPFLFPGPVLVVDNGPRIG